MRKTLTIGVTLALCVALCGCSETKKTIDPNLPIDVNIDVDPNIVADLEIAYIIGDREKSIVQGLADGFNELYPNVEIKLTAMSDTSSTIQKKYQAGTMPDIFFSESFSMFQMSATDGILLNLSPYIEAEEAAGTFDRNDYYSAFWKLGQYNFDGDQYLIPRSADRVVCHYNKYIIAQAEKELGVDIQKYIQNGWTWDDFDTVCDYLTQYSVYRNNDNRFIADTYMEWEAVWNPIFEAYGVQYFDENGDIAIDSEETENALDLIKSWVDNGYAASPSSSYSADFNYGKGVFFFHSVAASEEAKNITEAYNLTDSDGDGIGDNVSDYYDVVTMPVVEGNEKIGGGAAGYCAYAGTEHPDLVWKFMKYMLSKDGQNAIADAGMNYVPVRMDMADYTDPENHWGAGFEDFNLSAYTYMSGGYDEDGNEIADWNCYTDYFTVKAPKYASNLNSYVSELVKTYASGKPYSDCMTTLKKYWNAILSR